MTKIEKLKNWMKKKGEFFTHEVVEWGFRNMLISSDRQKRKLMERGLIMKIDDDYRKDDKKEAKYVWVGEEE